MAKQEIAKHNEDIDETCNYCKEVDSTANRIRWQYTSSLHTCKRKTLNLQPHLTHTFFIASNAAQHQP